MAGSRRASRAPIRSMAGRSRPMERSKTRIGEIFYVIVKNFPTKNDRIRGPSERSKRGTSRAPGAAVYPFRLLFLCWAVRVALRRRRSTRTSTRSRDAGFLCVFRCVFRCLRFAAIRTRDSTRTDTRRMDSLGPFMTPDHLMISSRIATPAAIVILNSRRSSASPVYRIRHNSRLAPYARVWSRLSLRHVECCAFFAFRLASLAFKSPAAEGPRRRVGARFSRLAIRARARLE